MLFYKQTAVPCKKNDNWEKMARKKQRESKTMEK